jgi:hypothetical protein
MVRWLARGVLPLLLVGTVLPSTGRGQPAKEQDRIYYREKKDRDGNPKFVEGEVKLTPAGYQIFTGGKSISVSPLDIVRVTPADLPGVDAKDLSSVGQTELSKEWEKARVGYDELRKKAGAPPEKVRQFLDFKVATMTARAADLTPDDAGWKEKATAASTLLTQYLSDHKTGWEVYPAGRTSARLQTELGQHEAAARLWAKLATSAEVPADLRQEALFQEVDSLIRAKRYPDAGNRAAEAIKTATAGAPKDRLNICQIVAKKAETDPLQGVAPIEEEIAKTKDPVTRAVGYAMLGELYLAANKPREAMWMELWVEVVYNQDRDEVTKALCRLAETFQAQGDEERAKATREKLRRHRASL